MANKEHYESLPEPPSRGSEGVAERFKPRTSVKYLESLEDLINNLHVHLLSIQSEEEEMRRSYTAKMAKFKPLNKDDKQVMDQFEVDLDKIKERREGYRATLYKAHKERRKLLESMQLHRLEEQRIKRDLDSLAFLNTEGPKRSTRWDLWSILFFVAEILTIIVFVVVTDFSSNVNPEKNVGPEFRIADYWSYAVYIMLFLFAGVGLLNTVMRKYAFSGFGFSILNIGFAIQWAILFRHLWLNVADHHNDFIELDITITTLIDALYTAFAVLIVFAASMGRMNPLQLTFVTFGAVFWYELNYYVSIMLLDAVDSVGPITVHMFGAVFGLALTFVTTLPILPGVISAEPFKKQKLPTYNSNSFSFIGTLLLFALFPALNTALIPGSAQFRVAINTMISLSFSAVFTFITSRALNGGKYDMRHLQHAAIAGGIASAGAVGLVVTPGGAAVIGAVAGAVSTIGFAVIDPLAAKYVGLVDEGGVLSGHFIPGLIGAVAGTVAIAVETTDDDHIFGNDIKALFKEEEDQAGHQTAAIFITFGIALLGGLLTGLFVWVVDWGARKLLPGRVAKKQFYSDATNWIIPADYDSSLRDREELGDEVELRVLS
eukprot:TRINITY_DN4_c0_g1_i1.p1 TRINITY_DN4_c0_g1~~TRINITY_DN4_c0_g1_i1.p1  ORF type:complete len:603 (-),score=101.57 TRINITY_DN4_c0_g1_i1:71-1879(-)